MATAQVNRRCREICMESLITIKMRSWQLLSLRRQLLKWHKFGPQRNTPGDPWRR